MTKQPTESANPIKTKKRLSKTAKVTIWAVAAAAVALYAILLIFFVADRSETVDIERVTYKETYIYSDGDEDVRVDVDTDDRVALKNVQTLLERRGIKSTDEVCLNYNSPKSSIDETSTKSSRSGYVYSAKIHYRDGTEQDMSCEPTESLTSAQKSDIRELRNDLSDAVESSTSSDLPFILR